MERMSLQEIATEHDFVVLDNVFSGSYSLADTKRRMQDLDRVREATSRNLEDLKYVKNALLIEDVEKELDKFIESLKKYRSVHKKKSGRLAAQGGRSFEYENRIFDLADSCLKNLQASSKRLRGLRHSLPKINPNISGELLHIVDSACRYAPSIGFKDIRKENSNTDEKILASVFSYSLQGEGDIALITNDYALGATGDIVSDFLTSESFFPDNGDIVDMICDNPVTIYTSRRGVFDFAKLYDETIDSIKIKDRGVYSSVRRHIKELAKHIEGRPDFGGLSMDAAAS